MRIFAGFLLLFSQVVFAEILSGTFQGARDADLKYIVGKNTNSTKAFIYVEGDGDVCYRFEPQKIAQIMAQMSVKDNWVAYETSKMRYCDQPQFGGLDYHHRTEEIIELVEKLRVDFPEVSKNIYLMGHSGGPHLILRAMKQLKDIRGVVLMSSGHSPLDSVIIKKRLIDGYKNGKDEAAIKTEVNDLHLLFNKILNNCDSPQAIWGLRSNKFWCQMFEASMDANAAALPKETKILIVHGYKDPVVPVEDAFEFYASLLKAGKNVELKIYPDMEHGFWPKIKELLALLSEF